MHMNVENILFVYGPQDQRQRLPLDASQTRVRSRSALHDLPLTGSLTNQDQSSVSQS